MALLRKIKNNTYILETRSVAIPVYFLNKSDVIFLDSGFNGDSQEINNVLSENGLKVIALLTSHVHYDHVGCHLMLREKYGAEIYMCSYDAAISESYLGLHAAFSGYSVREIEKTFPYMKIKTDRIFCSSADHVEVCGARFRIVHTPGHAYEHICFVTPDNILYAGDQLLTNNTLDRLTWIFCECPEAYLKNIDMLEKMKFDGCICAHCGYENDLTELCRINRKALIDQIEYISGLITGWSDIEQIIFNARYRNGKLIGKEHVLDRIIASAVYYLYDRGELERKFENGVFYYRSKEQ